LVVPRRLRFGGRPDVWLSNGHKGPLEVDEPVVSHLQEAPWLDTTGNHFLTEDFSGRLLRNGDAATREATLVITAAEAARQQIINTHDVAADRVRVVPHGVDTEIFNPARSDRGTELVRGAGGLVPYILFVMRWSDSAAEACRTDLHSSYRLRPDGPIPRISSKKERQNSLVFGVGSPYFAT
jgi:glycosyltransferase involved in cell wall biosynthesis